MVRVMPKTIGYIPRRFIFQHFFIRAVATTKFASLSNLCLRPLLHARRSLPLRVLCFGLTHVPQLFRGSWIDFSLQVWGNSRLCTLMIFLFTALPLRCMSNICAFETWHNETKIPSSPFLSPSALGQKASFRIFSGSFFRTWISTML